MNRRSTATAFALLIALVSVALVLGRGRSTGPPLDPNSTAPLGTHALVALLESFEVDVRRGLPDQSDTVALFLAGTLDDDRTDQLEQWVSGGGRLVVASPGSAFSPQIDGLLDRESLSAGICEVPGLDDVARLGGSSFGTYVIGPESTGCFLGPDGQAYLIAEDRGAGQIIAIGGAAPLTNELLDEEDNAVLAVRLLEPDSGSLRVIYDPAGIAGAGDQSLVGLIPGSVRLIGWQLLVAFAVFVLWRARRFGRVVEEPQPVELPGSLLVLSSGELRRRSGGYAAAMAAIRRDTEVRLRTEHRIPTEVSTERLAVVLQARSGLDSEALRRALLDPLPPGPEGLTALVAAVDALQPPRSVRSR